MKLECQACGTGRCRYRMSRDKCAVPKAPVASVVYVADPLEAALDAARKPLAPALGTGGFKTVQHHGR